MSKEDKRIKTSIRDKALKLLQDRPASLKLKQIATDTGLPEGWLSMFHRDEIPKPNVNYIQTLIEYLTHTEIKV